MAKIDGNTIGGRLKLWRKHLGISGEELGKMVDIHVGMIRKYETNVAVPGGESLIALSKTGLNVQWLLLGTGEMSDTLESAKRETALLRLLDDLDSTKREALLNEFFARIQDAKQLAELKEMIEGIRKNVA